MDGRERREVEVLAAAGEAQFAPELEALPQVHVRPPMALASGEIGARENRVVRADPAAERRLQPDERKRGHQRRTHCRRDRGALRALAVPRVRHSLPAQQRQQHQAAQQVQRHDRREQLHRHGPGAERALHAHPRQRRRGPPGMDRHAAPALPPRRGSERQDQHADAGGHVAVDHLDPGLGVGHRPRGHRSLRARDFRVRAGGADVAIAARPVGAAQAGVGQAREGTEQHQVEGEEQGEQRQRMQPAHRAGLPVAQPHPRQRAERDGDPHQHEVQRRREVVQRRVHRGPASTADAPADPTRRRRAARARHRA